MVGLQMEHIPNYCCGYFRSDGKQHILLDPDGRPCASGCFLAPSEVRSAKRELLTIQRRLNALPLEAVLDFLQRLPAFLVSQYDVDLVAKLSGSNQSSIVHSLERRVAYCSDIRECLGDIKRGEDKADSKGPSQAFKQVDLPGGPVIAVLPKNSDEEAFYVIVQALLSRCVCLVRCPSSGFSSLPAIFLARAMSQLAGASNKPEDHLIASSFCVLNTERGGDDNAFIRNLFMPDAAWVLFGTSATVSALQSEIRKIGPARRILEFGSGFGIAIVSADADIDNAASEIAEGITFNNGNECIGTKLIYVHQSVRDAFVGRLKQLCGSFDRNGPWGKMTQSKYDSIKRSTGQRATDGYVQNEAPSIESVRLCDTPDSKLLIVPAPLASVYCYDGVEDLTQQIIEHLQQSEVNRPLSLSLFCGEYNALSESLVPSVKPYVLKKNRSTHRMNMMSPHQGVVLWKEFLETVTCEV
jgi:hypothetical protein